MWAGVDDLFPNAEPDAPEHHPRPRLRWWLALLSGAVVLVVVTALVTVGVTSQQSAPPPESPNPGADSPTNDVAVEFGAQDTVIDEVTIPAGEKRASLLHFDVDIAGIPTAKPRAAMVALRVECRTEDGRVEMQTDGKQTTNVFLAQGGSMAGQALTAESDEKMTCTLLASAPYIEKEDDGLTHLQMQADLRLGRSDTTHMPALRWLDDATLLKPGDQQNVLSRQIDAPAALEQMSTTVRLTSCTVVGGSRDGGGEYKCEESMTGRESSTVRVRVIARWLDEEDNITSTSTLWDETLAVDYNTHHVPWTLQQDALAERAPDDASAMVVMVQVESVAGTPVVIHADGTDSVLSIIP